MIGEGGTVLLAVGRLAQAGQVFNSSTFCHLVLSYMD